jgi:hypothetical protein
MDFQRWWQRVFVAFVMVATGTTAALATQTEFVAGKCSAKSHTAEGPIGSDLTKRQSRFFCDTAIIMFLDDYPGHVLINFLERRSNHTTPLGFAGRVDSSGQLMEVEHVYLQSGYQTTVSEGFCKFFFRRRHMTDIVCGMKVDEVGRRTAAIVSFEAAPGQ